MINLPKSGRAAAPHAPLVSPDLHLLLKLSINPLRLSVLKKLIYPSPRGAHFSYWSALKNLPWMVLIKRTTHVTMMSVAMGVVHQGRGWGCSRMYTLRMPIHHEIMLCLLLVRIRGSLSRGPWRGRLALTGLHWLLARMASHKMMDITRKIIVIVSRGCPRRGSRGWWHTAHGVTMI